MAVKTIVFSDHPTLVHPPDNMVRIWAQSKRLCVSCVWVLERGHSGEEGRIVCSEVRRVRRGSISSELLMCGGGVCSIFLLHFVTRCI